jgi:hypothetical protein
MGAVEDLRHAAGRRHCSLHRTRRADLRDANLVPSMRAQCILRHELLRHLASEIERDAPGDIDLSEFPFSYSGSPMSSLVSRARSACSVSDCELTETYSPAAMDMAPETRPATPAIRTSRSEAAAEATPEDQTCGRDDPVVCTEYGRTQPSNASDKVPLSLGAIHGSAPLYGFPVTLISGAPATLPNCHARVQNRITKANAASP